MSLNALLGVACILSFLLPVVVICYNRFYTHRSLAALSAYYLITALDNTMAQGIIPVPTGFSVWAGVLNNFLDVPLMLTALLFFCPGRQKQKAVHVLTGCFIGYEIIVMLMHGFTPASVIYVMGPGILIVLGYSLFLFVRQVKFSIVHGKNQGRTLMLASIFFMYASYALIYYFFYVMKTPFKADTIILYFIASGIASALMALGLHMMRRRMKELESIKTTRRELAMFFGQSA
jgi:hypothetical protein